MPEETASLSHWITMQHPQSRTPLMYRFILETATILEVNSLAFETANKGRHVEAAVISPS
jgi:hypothetical protein